MAHNKVHLIISTTAGDLEEDFPLHQPLHALKSEVMGKLHLDPSKAGDYVFALNGNVLDDTKTLQESGVQDGATLILERKEVVKV